MFSEKLKELRKEKGVSQEALSELLNVSRQSISKYENGTAQPDFEKLALIANYFEVSFDYLLGNLDKKSFTKKPINEGTHRISIMSKINGQLSSFYKFQLANVFGKKKGQPAVQMLGIDATTFWGENMVPLAWYESMEDGQKELQEIYAALSEGQMSYQLKYDVPVKRKGWFDFVINR